MNKQGDIASRSSLYIFDGFGGNLEAFIRVS